MIPSKPPQLLAFLMRKELVTPDEAKVIYERVNRSRRPRPWYEIVSEFEQIIGRTV